MWLLMLLFPRMFAGIFSSDASLVDYTVWAMRIYMAGIFSTGVQIGCQQTFMALGQAKISLLMACLRTSLAQTASLPKLPILYYTSLVPSLLSC